MDAKEMEFTPGISHWEEGQSEKNLSSRKRLHKILTICQITLQGDQCRVNGEGQDHTLISPASLCTALPLYLNEVLILGPLRWT